MELIEKRSKFWVSFILKELVDSLCQIDCFRPWFSLKVNRLERIEMENNRPRQKSSTMTCSSSICMMVVEICVCFSSDSKAFVFIHQWIQLMDLFRRINFEKARRREFVVPMKSSRATLSRRLVFSGDSNELCSVCRWEKRLLEKKEKHVRLNNDPNWFNDHQLDLQTVKGEFDLFIRCEPIWDRHTILIEFSVCFSFQHQCSDEYWLISMKARRIDLFKIIFPGEESSFFVRTDNQVKGEKQDLLRS